MGAHSNLGIFQLAATEMDAAGLSENMIDMDQVINKIGVGQHAPFLCIRMHITSETDADTLAIELRMSATESGDDLSGTITTVFAPFCGNLQSSNGEIAANHARSASGQYLYRAPLPYELTQRYVQLYFQNAAATGHYHIDAWLSDGPPSDFRGSQILFSDVGQP